MKRKLIFLLTVITFFAVAAPQKAQAFDQTSAPSANIVVPQITSLPVVEHDNRAQILRSYLEQQGSPLADHADTLVKEADANNIDWRLLAAISGVESTFGQAIPLYSYNAWGYNIYGNNVRGFASWDDGITQVSTDIRQIYMNQRGATNVYQIGSTYAASPTWAYRVQGYMDDIEQYSHRFDKPSLSISL